MSDPLVDLADAAVTALTTALPATVSIGGHNHPVTVAWTDNPNIDLEDPALLDPIVWVLDWGKVRRTENHIPVEEYEILTIVTQKILNAAGAPDQCRVLKDLVSQIENFFGTLDTATYLEVGEGGDAIAYLCTGTRRNPAHNLNDWHQEKRFFAEVVSTWKRA